MQKQSSKIRIQRSSTKSDTERLKERKLILQKEKLKRQYPNLYWAKFIHLNNKGGKMSFGNERHFSIAIYKALHEKKHIVCQKSVQNGISEAFNVSGLEKVNSGLSAIYVLPDLAIRNRYVQNRVNKMIAMVPEYREIISSSPMRTDSVGLKMFGKGVINYVSANSEASFLEFPADLLIYDEKDRMDQDIIQLGPDRLSESDHGLIWEVSNPTIADFGISYAYENSTKGLYMFKCNHCGKWQEFDFFKNVVRQIAQREFEPLDKSYDRLSDDEIKMYCSNVDCKGVIDRYGVQREWVEEHPKRKVTGFKLSKLIYSKDGIKPLVDRCLRVSFNDTKWQRFVNSDLGEAIEGTGAEITRESILASRENYKMDEYGKMEKRGLRYMGVDVGAVLHCVVREWNGNKKKLIWHGHLKDVGDLLGCIGKYGVGVVVIDALPEIRMVETFKKSYDRAYSCRFSNSVDAGLNKKDKTINIERTSAIDRVQESYNAGLYINPQDIGDHKEYVDHLRSSIRIYDPQMEMFRWLQKSEREDHYLLAEAYCDIAFSLTEKNEVFRFYEQENERANKDKPKIEQFDETDFSHIKDVVLRQRLEKKHAETTDEFFRKISDFEETDYDESTSLFLD